MLKIVVKVLKAWKYLIVTLLAGYLFAWFVIFQVGRTMISFEFRPLHDEEALRNVLVGGEYRPKDNNTSKESIAIIVPYRNRYKHREIFLQHMHTFLQKQQLHYVIFFVEMAIPTVFNRGLLLNVGFSIAKEIRNFSCFVFHDVDLLPMNNDLRYTCDGSIRHLCVENSKFNYGLPYNKYMGGVLAFPGDLYTKVNGFSNGYFGWGGEDDDLAIRIRMSNLEFKRPRGDIGRYHALYHNEDRGNPMNFAGSAYPFVCPSYTGWTKEGLNSLQVTDLKREARPLYTWIYVEVKEKEVMSSITRQYLCPSVIKFSFLIIFVVLVLLVCVKANRRLFKTVFNMAMRYVCRPCASNVKL